MAVLPTFPDLLGLMAQGHWVYDDFDHYVTADLWTTVATDSGTVAVSDGVRGEVALTCSDGTVADNDEIYMGTTTEIFKFAANKPLYAECRLKYTEQSTDDANVAFGLKDAVAANSLLDDGGGPAASYSGALFYKVDGGTVWNVENSISTTQKTTTLDATGSLTGEAQTAGGGTYQVLRIECLPKGGSSGTLQDIMFYIDGVCVAKHTDQSISSATDMELFVGAKNGGANNEVVTVDYIWAWQKR